MDKVLRQVATELAEVGNKLGYNGQIYTPQELLEYNESLALPGHFDAGFKASMMLDVAKGKPFELEVILGEVVRSGKEVGVATPL